MRMRGLLDSSAHVGRLAELQDLAGQGAGVRKVAQMQETADRSSPLAGQRVAAAGEPANPANDTGIPASLRAGLERLSGMDLSGVNVHYSSSRPARLAARAYAQGKDIFLAPGQERHLPHEGWHAVQQLQGRVRPTAQFDGAPINDDPALEREADRMGARARSLAPSARPGGEPAAQMQASLAAQRVKIAGERIRPTGKSGKKLLAGLKHSLILNKMSPHGVGKKFKKVVDKRDRKSFQSIDAFLGFFLGLARTEVARVEKARSEKKKVSGWRKKGISTRGWTRPLVIGRPTWPSTYKEAIKEGENIRHIVRNATLKKAIEGEWNHQDENYGETTAMKVMKDIARKIGISGDYKTAFEWTKAIYKAAYLNLGNLFPGPGAVNQEIGLTADSIIAKGLALMKSDNFASPEKVSEIFKDVAGIIAKQRDSLYKKAKKTMNLPKAEVFLDNFKSFLDNLDAYLSSREAELIKIASRKPDEMDVEGDPKIETRIGVTEAEIGRELLDIGANFGFDIPMRTLAPEDIQTLIRTEISLAEYKVGNPDQLAQVLQEFISVKPILPV